MTTNIYEMTDTWNDAGTVFTSIKMTITDTAKAAGSKMIDITTSVAGGYYNVDFNGNMALSGYIDLNPITAPAHSEGRVFYDSVRKTLSYYNAEPAITQNVGEEEWFPVWNDTGVQIDDGKPVYITGVNGGIPTVALAIADGIRVLGLATHNIGDGERGYVTRSGGITGPDYSSFNNGDIIYLSPSVAGDITNVLPAYPLRVIELGTIVDASNPGSMIVDLEHHGGPVPILKSYTFASRAAAAGEYFQAGYYDYSATDANLTNASPTVVHGTANHPYAAHPFVVLGGVGTTDGSDLVLTVSGTSITDAGVRTPADTEIIVADGTTVALNEYYETAKKFVGAVTFTLTSTGGTTFTLDVNYGTAKYEDFNNVDVSLIGIECVGLANAADTGFNIELIHHTNLGWTYAATGFQAGNLPVADMNTDHGTEKDLAAGEQFAWKRTNLSDDIVGSVSEGLIIRITTSTVNAVSYMDSHLTVTSP